MRLLTPHLGSANSTTGVNCALLIAELGSGCTVRQVATGLGLLPPYVNRLIRNMQQDMPGGLSDGTFVPLVRHELPDGGRADKDTTIAITEHGRMVFAEIESVLA